MRVLKEIPNGFHWEVGTVQRDRFYCHMNNRDLIFDGEKLFSGHFFGSSPARAIRKAINAYKEIQHA